MHINELEHTVSLINIRTKYLNCYNFVRRNHTNLELF